MEKIILAIEEWLKRAVFTPFCDNINDSEEKGGKHRDKEAIEKSVKKHAVALLKGMVVFPLVVVVLLVGDKAAAIAIVAFSLAIQAMLAGPWFSIEVKNLPCYYQPDVPDATTGSILQAMIFTAYAVIVTAACMLPSTLLVVIPTYWWAYKAVALHDAGDYVRE